MRITEYSSSSAEFAISFDGQGLSDHSIAVRDLAPSLLALDDLFRFSNEELNGEISSTSLSVRAFGSGSFETEMALSVIPVYAAVIGGDVLSSAANLVRLLFGGTAPGLFTLVKNLRGRSHTVTGQSEDNITIEADWVRVDGIVEAEKLRMTLPKEVIRLFENSNVRQSAAETLAPLKRDGVEEILVREGGRELEKITKGDFQSFETPSMERPLSSAVVRRFLVIDTSRLSDKSRIWRFSDGSQTSSYTMRDDDFIESVMKREVGFRAGDVFECDVKTSQRFDRSGVIKTDLEILKVFRHHTPSDRTGQSSLDL